MSDYPKIRLSEGPPKILKTHACAYCLNSMIPYDGPQTKKMLQHENLLSNLVGSVYSSRCVVLTFACTCDSVCSIH
ncbi:hypothetical protein T01_200 [Trichinella spiralis]|uniref:Uncharacterized protein n=1 Tax=Trichinella spiralis TaxID=6334 RepID=A0A0V1B8Y4_TRISP|nr:hypothetical protein T01_200 [Trichinella spiralis]